MRTVAIAALIGGAALGTALYDIAFAQDFGSRPGAQGRIEQGPTRRPMPPASDQRKAPPPVIIPSRPPPYGYDEGRGTRTSREIFGDPDPEERKPLRDPFPGLGKVPLPKELDPDFDDDDDPASSRRTGVQAAKPSIDVEVEACLDGGPEKISEDVWEIQLDGSDSDCQKTVIAAVQTHRANTTRKDCEVVEVSHISPSRVVSIGESSPIILYACFEGPGCIRETVRQACR